MQKHKPSKAERPAVLRNLLILLCGATLVVVTMLWVRHALLNPTFESEEKLGILSGACLGLLLIGLAVLNLALRKGSIQLSPIYLFLLAYAVPALIFLLPFAIKAIATSGSNLPEALELSRARSNLFIWQACVLAGWQVVRILVSHKRIYASAQPLWKEAVPGILCGLGTWMVIVFSSSLISAHFAPSSPLYTSIPLPGMLIPAAVVLSPFGAQITYRLQIEGEITSPKRQSAMLWLSAALFALLQFRLLLILPAFLASLSFSWLTDHNRNLLPAMLAHSVTNLLMLYFNWQMVI